MTDEAMSPLRRRMIEDMTIRKFAPEHAIKMYKGPQSPGQSRARTGLSRCKRLGSLLRPEPISK
jgi:hypothetical protein